MGLAIAPGMNRPGCSRLSTETDKDRQRGVKRGGGMSRSRVWLWVAGLALAFNDCSALVVNGSVVFNEVMAINRYAVERGNDFPDYIEFYNKSNEPLDLGGMSLTDDPANRRLFVFPAGIYIPAQSYLIVWCDLDFNKAGLHSGFGLSATGDHLWLYGADGQTVLDEVVFGIQVPDLSISRIPDGTGNWLLSKATPLESNSAMAMAALAFLRMNEWLAKPSDGDDWIELYNTSALPAALGGLVLTDKSTVWPDNRPIPTLSFIGGHGYVVLQATGLEKPDADHLDFKLGASGETIRLLDASRSVLIDRISFGAQITDVSQGRAPDGSSHIISFPAGKATPGDPNVIGLTSVVISEVLSHTDPPLEDAIELQNTTQTSVDIGYWWLSDEAAQPKKYRIPSGTVLAPGGFMVIYENQFSAGANGFSLDSAEGDEVFLSEGEYSGELTGRQTSVSISPLKNGISAGRHRTSAGVDFTPLSHRTFGNDQPTSLAEFRLGKGQSNAPPLVGAVVISEIMFYPPDIDGSLNSKDEFVELHNRTSSPAALFDPNFPTNRWRLRNGIIFEFPPDTTISPGGFLIVVNFNPALDPAQELAFRTKFSVSPQVPVIGPYGGKLSDMGETIELVMPDQPQGPDKPNAGYVPYVPVETIRYVHIAPWPAGAAGTGQSLQRRQAAAYGNEPTNWLAAEPTPGSNYLADSDRDGLPDEWEVLYELNPQRAADALEDADGDQVHNLAEFQAGTHPKDPESVFRIWDLSFKTGEWLLSFSAVAGRSYTVEALQDSEFTWRQVTNINPASMSGRLQLSLPSLTGRHCWIRLTTP